MEQLGDTCHLGEMELVSGALEKGLGRTAADVVFEDKTAREGVTFVGGFFVIGNDE